MTHKLNCWEYNNCGREPGGILADQLGVCPITTEMKCDGDNGGIAGGRVCWTIPIADQQGLTLKSCADKACLQCSFYKRIQFEETSTREKSSSITIVAERTISESEPAAQETEETVEVA